MTELFRVFETERRAKGWPEFICCPIDEVDATCREFGAKVYAAVYRGFFYTSDNGQHWQSNNAGLAVDDLRFAYADFPKAGVQKVNADFAFSGSYAALRVFLDRVERLVFVLGMGGVERFRRMPRPAADFVQAQVAGDGEEPGRERRPTAELAQPARRGQKRVLHHVLRVLRVAAHLEAEAEDAALLLLEKGLEGGPVSGPGRLEQCAVVHSGIIHPLRRKRRVRP